MQKTDGPERVVCTVRQGQRCSGGSWGQGGEGAGVRAVPGLQGSPEARTAVWRGSPYSLPSSGGCAHPLLLPLISGHLWGSLVGLEHRGETQSSALGGSASHSRSLSCGRRNRPECDLAGKRGLFRSNEVKVRSSWWVLTAWGWGPCKREFGCRDTRRRPTGDTRAKRERSKHSRRAGGQAEDKAS